MTAGQVTSRPGHNGRVTLLMVDGSVRIDVPVNQLTKASAGDWDVAWTFSTAWLNELTGRRMSYLPKRIREGVSLANRQARPCPNVSTL